MANFEVADYSRALVMLWAQGVSVLLRKLTPMHPSRLLQKAFLLQVPR